MKSGLELDVLVTTKIMGVVDDVDSFVDGRIYVFSPSIRIQDAWQVIEKMEATGYRFVIHTDISTYGSGKKLPLVRVFDKNSNFITKGVSDSIPRSICLAALKVVGVEVDETVQVEE